MTMSSEAGARRDAGAHGSAGSGRARAGAGVANTNHPGAGSDTPGAGSDTAGFRPIVSFQPRGGRMNDVQKRAWDAYADRWLIERDELPVISAGRGSGAAPERCVDPTTPAEAPGIDQQRIFGRVAPLVVEIGPGMGDATAAMAAARPEIDLLAIEVYKPGIAQTFAHLARAGVTNVRVLRADAAEVLRSVIAPASLAELWLFFPDPWRKRKHHKRRIVTPGFAELVASRLVPGGSWYLATDWEHYAKQMLAVVSACGALRNPHEASGGWAPRAPFRPETRFEKRGLGADRVIYDLHVTRA